MYVALVAPPWLPVPPPAYGGTEVVVDTLARGLHAAGHDVLLVTTGDSTSPVDRAWVYERARPDDLGNNIIELRHALYAFEAADGADIIHDHTIAGPLLASRFAHSPVVTTNHGPFSDDMRALYRATAERVPVVAISHHHAATARGLPIAAVIHHGLAMAEYPVGQGGGGYLLFLGRMSPVKGVREAIEVARLAGVPLVIAAKMREPMEREYFESTVAPLLGGDISYAGEVGMADKVALLREAVGLINPLTWDEPFGLSMIEALACGTPVIATARGSVPEIVDEGITGFVRTGVDAMVGAVERIDTIDRCACRAAAEARFSGDRMTADYIALFERTLEGRVVDLDGRGHRPEIRL